VKNWERSGAPVAIIKLFRLMAQDLSWIGQDWEGFTILEDRIIGPGRAFITPGMIRAYPYLESELERRRAADLERWRHRQRRRNWIKEGRELAATAFQRFARSRTRARITQRPELSKFPIPKLPI
jgi:hypothetical protein